MNPDHASPQRQRNSRFRVLILEDENIGHFILEIVKDAGYTAKWIRNRNEAAQVAATWQPDVILADLCYDRRRDDPEIELIRELHDAVEEAEILAVTGVTLDATHAEVVLAGASAYITKPFDNSVLLAHIYQATSRPKRGGQSSLIVVDAHLHVDTSQRAALYNGERLNLTPIEYQTLECLAKQVGRLVPYSAIILYVWGRAYDNHDGVRNLHTHTANLRGKLDMVCPTHEYITTKIGVGYILTPQRD